MSIEALNWARKIHVGDSLAKSLLRGIADYADENGKAFPSHGRLASDCEMSESTVKRKIAWLEERGLLATFRAWMDDRGMRNHEQRGRETSRDIVLALDKRIAAPLPDDDDNDDNAERGGSRCTPSNQIEGVHAEPHGVQAAPPGGSLVTTPNEPSLNQEDSPQAPQAGGGVSEDPDVRKRFDYFLTNCLGWRTQSPDRAFEMFKMLTEAEQVACAAASPAHAAECTKARKKSLDAWKLIRERFWMRYPDARMPAAPPTRIWIDEADLEGLRVALRIADQAPLRVIDDAERGRGQWRSAAIPPDMAALSAFAKTSAADWVLVQEGSHEFAAWRSRLIGWIGVAIEPQKRWLEPFDSAIHAPSSPNFRLRECEMGLAVPCRWPPKKDGTIYHDDDNAHGGEQQ